MAPVSKGIFVHILSIGKVFWWSCRKSRKQNTFAPNSIKLARFCKHFATIVKVLLAIGEGVSASEREKKNLIHHTVTKNISFFTTPQKHKYEHTYLCRKTWNSFSLVDNIFNIIPAIILHILGFIIAGQKQRRKRNALKVEMNCVR